MTDKWTAWQARPSQGPGEEGAVDGAPCFKQWLATACILPEAEAMSTCEAALQPGWCPGLLVQVTATLTRALRMVRGRREAFGRGLVKPGKGLRKTRHIVLTISELKGLVFVVRAELLVRDQTLVLCLKAALTFRGRRKSLRGSSRS